LQSSVPYQPASEEEELMARSQTSVLQEVSMRRRKTAIVIGCLCFVLFLAGNEFCDNSLAWIRLS